MARVLLVGRGPLPRGRARRVGFPQLRLDHLRRGLEAAGHEVRVVLLRPPGEARGRDAVEEDGPGWTEQVARRAAGADVVVGAGPWGGPRAVALAAAGVPTWADVPGDPLAELQARATARAAARATARAAARAPARGEAGDRLLGDDEVAAALGAALLPLARADALSAVSAAQRHALLGQLGLAGRLLGPRAHEAVAVVPVAFRFPGRRRPPRPPPGRGEPLVVSVGGGMNAWFDDALLRAGLERLVAAERGLEVIVVGGPVDGLPAAGWRALEAWARGRPRVRVVRWPPHRRAAELLGAAHVGLCLDRPGAEPELGSRTRVLWYAWLGLRVVATPLTELVRDLADRGLVRPVPPGDAEALAAAVLEAGRRPAPPLAEHCARAFDPVATAAPLARWAARPERLLAPPRGELAAAAALAAEAERLRDELRRVHASPTWRALAALHRAVRRAGVAVERRLEYRPRRTHR